MQFVSALSSERGERALKEKPVGAHLPWSHQLDDHTIVTHDGRLMQFIRVAGLPFETADSEELNYRADLRDAMLRALGSSRFAVTHHILRRRIDPDLSGEFGDDFSSALDARWSERLASRELYVNELVIGIIRRPFQGKAGLAEKAARLFARAPDQKNAERANDLRQLSAAVEALLAALAAYGPARLTTFEQDGAILSEPLEFLSSLVNGDAGPVRLAEADLRAHIPRRRISFGEDLIELGPTGHEPRQFIAILSIRDYPSATAPGMLDDLLRLPIALTVSQSFALVDRDPALRRMNLALRRMRSAEDEALSLRDELAAAKDEVAAGRAVYGEHHTTIAVHGSSPEEADNALAEVSAALADLGIVAVREDIALEPAFWAQMPGNFQYIARKALISSRNFASLASLHNFASGRASANHWGSAVSLLETTAAGPYFFNFHQGDLGNFTIIGPSGSGKTVILNFLLAQARRFDPRIIFFDKDRGAELFIRAIGGRYDRLHPDAPTLLNPLMLADNPANRQFLSRWLAMLAGGADTEELEDIRDAIDANYSQPAELRRLRYLAQLLRGRSRPVPGDLYARLRPWWGDGPRAWLFDNEADHTDLAEKVVGFDITAILDDPAARTPVMDYLFHRVEQRLDGTPTIITVDEGWKALDDDVFVMRIRDWLKTIRKRNGIVGFATQSAQDALESRIASAVIEQAATQIFTVNPKGRAEHYCEGFGLTEHELSLVRSLPDAAHCFLIRHGNESVVVRLDLTGEKELITILSGREASVRRLDAIRATTGDDPAAWMPRLMDVA
jgi:type IV secretion system protein VirB4